MLSEYIQRQLSDDLPEATIDTSLLRRQGHSLGSVTANLGEFSEP